MSALILKELIENKIFTITGQKILLDSDLAMLYGIKTGQKKYRALALSKKDGLK
jgi:hypothetical protein